MATTARAWTHALCIVGFWLWRPSAPLKGGSLNGQQVRLDDGEEGVEAVFNQAARGWWRLAPFRGSPLAVGCVLDEQQVGRGDAELGAAAVVV